MTITVFVPVIQNEWHKCQTTVDLQQDLQEWCKMGWGVADKSSMFITAFWLEE